MTVAVTARTAGKVTLNVIGDRLLTTVTQDVQPGTARAAACRSARDWGTGAYVVATLAPSARRAGAAHAGPRHRRAVVRDRPQGAHARARHEAAAAACGRTATLRIPVKIDGLAAGEEARIVVAAVDVGILNLTNYKPPAPDDYYLGQRRLAAELRDLYGQLIDGMQGTRGQIRTGGDGRRRELQRQPADAGAARALLRHRHGRARRHRRGRLRHSGLRRHRARDGGGLEQGQGRPRHGRRHRPRSGGAHRDAAALPAHRRPRHHASRPRQRRRAGRRLSASTVQQRRRRRRSATPRRRRCSSTPSSAAPCRVPLTASGAGVGNRHGRASAGRAASRSSAATRSAVKPATQMLARRTVQPIAQGREPDAVERPVRRSRAGHRQRVGLGRPVDRARRGGAARGARPLSVRLLRADHQPRAAAALRQRLASAAHLALDDGGRPAHPRRHRPRAGAPGRRTARSASGRRRRRRRLARRLCHRLPDPRARARLRGAGRRRSSWRSTACATSSPTRRTPSQGRRPQSRLCALCAGAQRRGAGRRPALPRRHQARRFRHADRQGADRRGARHARRQARAPSASMRRRCASIAPQPTLEYRPRRLRLDAARRRGAGDARRAKAARSRADHHRRGRSASRRRAALAPYTSTQENAWLVLAARALAKDAGSVSLDVAGEQRQGRALPQRPARASCRSRCRSTNTGEGAAAGGGLGHRRAD